MQENRTITTFLHIQKIIEHEKIQNNKGSPESILSLTGGSDPGHPCLAN